MKVKVSELKKGDKFFLKEKKYHIEAIWLQDDFDTLAKDFGNYYLIKCYGEHDDLRGKKDFEVELINE